MKRFVFGVVATFGLLTFSAYVHAQGGILQPGDPIIAFDFDVASNSSYPGNESPANALDEDSNTKYLNFGQRNSGIIITPLAGSTIVRSMKFTTANDAVERDPSSWALFGTNDPILSTDNGDGTAENWTLISQNTVALPDTRFADGPVLSFANITSYASYRLVFPSVKNVNANSMQIADIRMYTSNDGTGSSFLNFLDPALAIHLPTAESRYPGNENPPLAIDRDINTKYLNFGRENSGFIVTPASGARVVRSFRFTTANDSPSRDPATWELYGTNAPIASVDNGDGNAEPWTLVDSGAVNLPDDRFTLGSPVVVNNNTAYRSYRMVVKSVKDPFAGDADSFQIAEVQFFQSSSGISADFNGDSLYDCADIDSLVAEIASGGQNLNFDLNGDDAITQADITAWLAEAGSFRPTQTSGGNPFRSGDANLDGVVDGTDFGIWNSNKFTAVAAWCRGDFNADGNVDGSDFGVWNSNKFTASDGGLVPEPASALAGILLAASVFVRRRR